MKFGRHWLFGIAAAALTLAVAAGCASSERMVRMSGGVLDSYSAPQKHRLRSEKSRKLSQHARARDERDVALDHRECRHGRHLADRVEPLQERREVELRERHLRS